MKSYLLSILAVSLSESLILHLLPEKTSLKKGVKFLSVLLLLSLLLSPLFSLKSGLAEFFSFDWLPDETALENGYEETRDDSLASYSKDYLETLVKERLVSAFGLRESDLRVYVTMENEEPKKVLLLLSGKAIWQDSAKLETFVENLLGLPVSSAIE